MEAALTVKIFGYVKVHVLLLMIWGIAYFKHLFITLHFLVTHASYGLSFRPFADHRVPANAALTLSPLCHR